MKLFKKILKIIFWILFVLSLCLYLLFYWFTSPKSDEKVRESYLESGVDITLSYDTYKEFRFRKIESIKDTTLPTLVFVHGTIGSVMDFKSYFADSLLSEKVNMIAYDRVGYNYNDTNPVQESIGFERDLLESLIKEIPREKVILVGYSYGGPIALASQKKIKKTILLAPAVYSKVEPMPGMLSVYKWKFTRWLVPPIWKQASKEKMSHPKNLEEFENTWNLNPNKILSIHGKPDWIVPYSNSEYLQKIFPKKQFELVTLSEANHDLIWSHFKEIRNLLLKQLNEDN